MLGWLDFGVADGFGRFLVVQVLYKESVGTGTPTPVTPEMERVKRNQEICSSVFCQEKKNLPFNSWNPELKPFNSLKSLFNRLAKDLSQSNAGLTPH